MRLQLPRSLPPQRQQQLLTDTINLYVTSWNEALTDALPRPQYARLNTGALLRSDLMTRYQSYDVAARIGLLTLDEMRQLEDLPPLPEAQ